MRIVLLTLGLLFAANTAMAESQLEAFERMANESIESGNRQREYEDMRREKKQDMNQAMREYDQERETDAWARRHLEKNRSSSTGFSSYGVERLNEIEEED